MNEGLQHFAVALNKSFLLHKIELKEEEKEFLAKFNETLAFYEGIRKCRGDNKNKSFRCIIKAFNETSCSRQVTELLDCHNYVKKRALSLEGSEGFQGLCTKQDVNFSKCFEDLIFPLAHARGGFRVRSPYLE